MNCKLCDKLVISTGVTWNATSLVIALPSGSFEDCEKLCLVVAQSRPAEATVDAPVVFAIGDGTTQYALVDCNSRPVTACQIKTRTRYAIKVTTTPTGAVFRMIHRANCCGNNLQAVSG